MKLSKIPKAYNFKPFNTKASSKRILENSLMFMVEGIEQIVQNPRQSIVSFWTGVELFIKAILVNEHWTLIVKDTRNITQEKFENGDFISVDFQHSITLLQNIFDISIDTKTIKAFDVLRNHRNKIMHFTNREIENKDGFELSDIFVELSNVWNELKGLYLPEVDIFGENIILKLHDKISDELSKHKVILEGKYQNVYETRLKKIPTSKILKCPSCEYCSAIIKPINKIVHEATCLVCEEFFDVLMIQCEHCKHENILHKSESNCTNCSKQIDVLAYIMRKENQNESQLGTCHRCGLKSVIHIEPIWYCISCYSLFGPLNICDHCGSNVTCSTKNSLIDGCICCEGPN